MDVTTAELEHRYASAPDEVLLEALAAGPSSYTNLAWSIISREAQARGLRPDAKSDTTPIGVAAGSIPPSSFFLWARLVQGARWDYSARSLPLRGLYFLAGAWALVGLWILVDVVAAFGHTAIGVLFGLALNLPFALVVIACITPRRPWKWYYLMLFTGVLVPLVQIVDYVGGDVGDPIGWRLFIYPLVVLAWSLYLARRRPAFGLRVWPVLM